MHRTAPGLDQAASAEAAFRDPATAQRPMLRWWWPGGAVDAAALCEQLRGFAAAGWGGVEIQPFRVGLPDALPAELAARVHEVHTPAWFDTVAAVMAEAERLGLVVDMTFGSAWPFGGSPAITPELATAELSLAWTTVQGPGPWQGLPRQPERPLRNATWLAQQGGIDPAQALPPDWLARIDALAQTVAVLAVRGAVPSLGPFPGFVPMTLPDRWGQVLAPGWVDAAATVDLSDRLQPDGRLAWDVPEGEWQIVVVRRFVSDQMLLEGAGRGPQLVLDHLQRAAFDAHAARVGDAALPHWAAHAGRSWRSVFVDSLEIPADLLWTADFQAEFQRRRGYDLRPHLPLLLQPGWRNCFQSRLGAPLFDDPAVGPRVRADYRLTVSELMIERLYAPLADWATAHGVQAKVQAHGAPVDWLQAYGVAGIPETEDLAGGAAPHFLRVARSAAHVYGRPLVTGEAFCFLLEGLAVTPQQIRERADAFYAAGIQQLVGHGASARLPGASGGTPWTPFEAMEIGSLLDDANPLWALQRPLVDYMARCQAILQRGQAQVPVAVLAPLDLFAFTSAAERLTPPAWHGALLDAGYDWDWLNPHGLLACRIEDGQLVTPGGHRYSAVLLPELPALRAEVAEKLAQCAAAGVAIWAIGAPPAAEEGWHEAAARDARVQAAMVAALHGGQRVATPFSVGQALRASGLAPLLDLPAGHGLQFHLRAEGAQRWLFLHNPQTRPAVLRLACAEGEGAELWHGWTGRVERLALDASQQLSVTVPAQGARLLRLAPTAALAPMAAPRTAPAAPGWEQVLAGEWTVRGQGLGLGGRAIAFEERWAALQDLSQREDLADFAGHLHYTLHFELPAQALAQGPLWLDLGHVADAAQVRVNESAPVVGCEGPFLFNLHAALRAGQNTLHISVANRPENARRDPARPGGLPLPGRRLSRLPTGLLGPVRLHTATAPATRWTLA